MKGHMERLRTIYSLVGRADCAFCAAIRSKGIDSHGHRIENLEQIVDDALEAVIAAGKLATEELECRKNNKS